MDIKVNEGLWASSMIPEGIVERWFVLDGSAVENGERLVELLIEDARHEVMSPGAGRLRIARAANDVIEPGSLLGRVE